MISQYNMKSERQKKKERQTFDVDLEYVNEVVIVRFHDLFHLVSIVGLVLVFSNVEREEVNAIHGCLFKQVSELDIVVEGIDVTFAASYSVQFYFETNISTHT